MKRRHAKRYRAVWVHASSGRKILLGESEIPRRVRRASRWCEKQRGGTLAPDGEEGLGRRAEVARRKPRAGRRRW